MIINQHRLEPAKQIVSPNYDERPNSDDISLLVIHCISLPPEQFGGHYIEDLFCNRLDTTAHPYFQQIDHLRVSAHLLIRRNGQILQFVTFDKRAWHAGVSHYQGRERCNDFSIGIELEGTEATPYSDPQYHRLTQVVRLLLAYYPRLNRTHIVGHSDIAPDRKTDPGPSFDWQRFYSLLAR